MNKYNDDEMADLESQAEASELVANLWDSDGGVSGHLEYIRDEILGDTDLHENTWTAQIFDGYIKEERDYITNFVDKLEELIQIAQEHAEYWRDRAEDFNNKLKSDEGMFPYDGS